MAQLLSIQPHSRHWLGLPAWSARFGRRTRTGVYAVLLAEHSGRAEVHSGFANSYFSIVPRFVDLRSASQLRICGLHLVVYLSSSSSSSWSKAVQTRSSYGYPLIRKMHSFKKNVLQWLCCLELLGSSAPHPEIIHVILRFKCMIMCDEVVICPGLRPPWLTAIFSAWIFRFPATSSQKRLILFKCCCSQIRVRHYFGLFSETALYKRLRCQIVVSDVMFSHLL